jgi:hypothetical protein
LGIIAIWFFNRKHFRPVFNVFILVSFIIIIYCIDLIPFLEVFSKNKLTNELILKHKDVDSAVTLTSSRSWLWVYHLSKLAESHFKGVGIEGVSFKVNDIVDSGEVAGAASESYYTQMLAAFGIFGSLIIIFNLYMFFKALKYKSLNCVFLLFIIIIITVSGGPSFFSLYSFNSIFIWGLVFNEMKKHKMNTLVSCREK